MGERARAQSASSEAWWVSMTLRLGFGDGLEMDLRTVGGLGCASSRGGDGHLTGRMSGGLHREKRVEAAQARQMSI